VDLDRLVVTGDRCRGRGSGSPAVGEAAPSCHPVASEAMQRTTGATAGGQATTLRRTPPQGRRSRTLRSEQAGDPAHSGYEIRIKGRITKASESAFDGLTVTVNPIETVVRGTMIDQAALYGILERIQALGLELVEIRRIPLVHDC
jgi:hypothetical protein